MQPGSAYYGLMVEVQALPRGGASALVMLLTDTDRALSIDHMSERR